MLGFVLYSLVGDLIWGSGIISFSLGYLNKRTKQSQIAFSCFGYVHCGYVSVRSCATGIIVIVQAVLGPVGHQPANMPPAALKAKETL